MITVEVIGNKAYSCKDNIESSKENQYHLISGLNSIVTHRNRKKKPRSEQAEFQEKDHFKAKAKGRYKIEAKNS
ncbi:hypothetical protein [Lacrimispora indolis]|uniref:hypothetical protein n=1 Tax=Lacrimispora indolis TaxID=69825 RepID=UPI00040FC0C8|nr:hypothetical protein [Lacrimispora indolis]MBE7719262.1 hypothetical protein [Lacrimispora celerecrescens]